MTSQNQKHLGCLKAPDDGCRSESKWKPALTRAVGWCKAGRLLYVMLTVCALMFVAPARSEELYVLDQQSGRIEFSVTHFGIFSSHGLFRRFSATLRLDSVHPERTSVVFDVDARSIEVPWQDWIGKLRSPAYFDVQEYPDIRFRSTAVAAEGPQHYLVHGLIEIRGVSRPIVLGAEVIDRERDNAKGIEIADLLVTGKIKRSVFGMVADPLLISDDIDLTIRVRLQSSEQLQRAHTAYRG